MNDNDTEVSANPKHRVIGAIVVVIIAVILIPMVLRDRASEAPPATAILTPDDANTNQVVVAPLAPTTAAPLATGTETSTATGVATTDAAAPPLPAPEFHAAPAAAPPATSTDATPGRIAATTAAKHDPALKAGWVVQVGTFASSSNAARLEQQLKKHGHTVSRDRVAIDKGQALRLRVGPFPERSAALKAQAKIKKETGIQGVVLAYR